MKGNVGSKPSMAVPVGRNLWVRTRPAHSGRRVARSGAFRRAVSWVVWPSRALRTLHDSVGPVLEYEKCRFEPVLG